MQERIKMLYEKQIRKLSVIGGDTTGTYLNSKI